MAFTLTDAARKWASTPNIEPNLVLEIPRLSTKFSVKVLKQTAKYGQEGIVYGLPGLKYGGLTNLQDQKPYIALKGTSDTITQQLDADQATSSSTTALTVRLMDINNEISNLISFEVQGFDLLQEDATLYVGGSTTSYPDDYIEIFVGKIQSINPGSGYIDFGIVHPDDVKRAEIFIKAETILTEPLQFNSKVIQDLFFQARPDQLATVSIEYVPGAAGDDAIITVLGNTISVAIDPVATKQKTIKKKIENDEDANQLVIVKITGVGTDIAAFQALTSLDTSTEAFVANAKEFLEPLPGTLFKTYARIGNEIVQYTSVDYVNHKLLGLTRGELNSFSFQHDEGTDVSSFYKLGDGTFDNGNAVDMALWILLSGGDEYFAEEIELTSFVRTTGVTTITNAVYFKGLDIKRRHGLTVGDFVSSSGADNASNDYVDRAITAFGEDDEGYYFILDGAALVEELNSPALLSFKSKYNVLPDGVGMLPRQVDIDQFLYVQETFSASMANYEFYLKDTLTAKDFISEEIFLPSALRSIPRKGRVSVSFSSPPLFSQNTPVLTLDTVKEPADLKLNRASSKNFYNAIVWRINEDSVEDKLLNGYVTLSNDSTNRIHASTKPIKINARGLRPSADNLALIERNTQRLLDRFQYAAESLSVEVPFKIGWNQEIGDAVIFGDPRLQVTDISTGDREFRPRVFEITNKKFNWKTGLIVLEITDTSFNQTLRFGVYSPSSDVDSGATTTHIPILDSFGTEFPDIEKDKWIQYIGKDLNIHDPLFVNQYPTVLRGFDPADPYMMIVEPALPAPPAAGWTIDIAKYDDIPEDTFLKAVNVFFDPTLVVTVGTSSTVFEVSVPDAAKLFVGSLVRVHNEDYSVDSGETPKKVTSILGTVITVEDLGFTSVAGYEVDLVGFASDEGKPYAWL